MRVDTCTQAAPATTWPHPRLLPRGLGYGNITVIHLFANKKLEFTVVADRLSETSTLQHAPLFPLHDAEAADVVQAALHDAEAADVIQAALHSASLLNRA